MISWALVQAAAQRALARGALQPIETRTAVVSDDAVAFVVRMVSSLARKAEAGPHAATGDPLGDYDRDLFVTDLAPTHYVLLNKFPVLPGHVLIVTRRFEAQEQLLTLADFTALVACLDAIDGLGFYNGGVDAGASQARKHLQVVSLPLAADSAEDLPIEPLLGRADRLPFRHAFARFPWPLPPTALFELYRELLRRCGLSAPTEEGALQSAPYNLLVRRSWMLIVPRSRAAFESIPVNALGFAGSLFVRSLDDLERIRAVGPMQVLHGVATPRDS